MGSDEISAGLVGRAGSKYSLRLRTNDLQDTSFVCIRIEQIEIMLRDDYGK